MNESTAAVHALPGDPVAEPSWRGRGEPDGECALLRQRIAEVAAGRAVLLHLGAPEAAGGQIGERTIGKLMRTLTQMQVILTYATGLPVVKAFSTAGAYPRQADTLKLVWALTAEHGPDLRQIPWAAASEEVDARHREQLARITRGLDFLKAYGLTRLTRGREVFAGHDYPVCADCTVAGHLLWLDIELADADRLDALARTPNALAVRLGTDVEPDRVSRLIDRLDPTRDPGRLTFVSEVAADLLPSLAEKVRATGADVCWVADLGQVASATQVHAFVNALRSVGAHPGGVHVTLSGPRGAALDLVLDLADALTPDAAVPSPPSVQHCRWLNLQRSCR